MVKETEQTSISPWNRPRFWFTSSTWIPQCQHQLSSLLHIPPHCRGQTLLVPATQQHTCRGIPTKHKAAGRMGILGALPLFNVTPMPSVSVGVMPILEPHGHQCTLPTCQQVTNFSSSQRPCGKSSIWPVEIAGLAAASFSHPCHNTLLHCL